MFIVTLYVTTYNNIYNIMCVREPGVGINCASELV